ncbi:PiggyBac transposable element-derived protein 4-like [Plakobranchus ocellatus]|uniref:PiggyBac transposable element-derived protein 4-like n=1 Tax=Plakobranchus ocellatus TaxID=259542 RepID=A0AAV3YQ02_9GAST|nr:PiggyBac transposable element-derived protein 4-like [Plakobranchus ocellatus]
MKPTKCGIKIYEVMESDSGYLLGMNVYTGSTAETTFHELVDLSDECTITTKIVVGLLAFCGLLHKGHHVYLDNYYNSPELFEELKLLGTGACGTIRTNRKNMPKANAAKIKLDPGESVFRQKDDMLALKFHDKRDVNMLSTIHSATNVVFRKTDKDGNNIKKPQAIVDYVKHMNGVDVHDQIVKNYSCVRKTVKWWKKLFFHLFCRILTNAYILYKKSVSKPCTHYQFRLQIVRKLMAEATNNPGPSTSSRNFRSLSHLRGKTQLLLNPNDSSEHHDKPAVSAKEVGEEQHRKAEAALKEVSEVGSKD